MTVIAQVSQPYVTIGRMIDLCICSLLVSLVILYLLALHDDELYTSNECELVAVA